MQLHPESVWVAWAGCIGLTELLRGECAGLAALQGRIGRAGAAETLLAAMDRFAELAAVQQSVFEALSSLALGASRISS